MQPLAQVYRMQKRFTELRRLRRQVLEVVGQTDDEAQSRGSADLWLYLLGTEANEAVDQRDLEHAEALNQQLYDYLTAQPDSDSDPRTRCVTGLSKCLETLGLRPRLGPAYSSTPGRSMGTPLEAEFVDSASYLCRQRSLVESQV